MQTHTYSGDPAVKKRSCRRFVIPGTTLSYKEKKWFSFRKAYNDDYLPVLDLSRGGAKFLSHTKLIPGTDIKIRLRIPGYDKIWSILAQIRWINKNPEQSYPYQIGISFHSFGTRKNKNPIELLNFLSKIENEYT